jgi:hypothetical protein
MKIAVVLSFFSPVQYELPQRHLHAVMNTLHAQGLDVVVSQAVFPGQNPQRVPSAIKSLVYKTSSLLFHKERLWNLAAKSVDSDAIIFLDSDVVFKDSRWIEKCEAAFSSHDIIQPFSMAIWQDEAGLPDMHREPFAAAIGRGEKPCLTKFHPGFGWGLTRDAFKRLGGFFDCSVAGNSDALFGLSLRINDLHEQVEQWYAKRQDPSISCASYRKYRLNASNNNFRIGVPQDVELVHLWHGNRANRQYISRTKLFPRRDDGEFAVHDAKNGLQKWDWEEEANASTSQYFKDKRDDG